MHLKNKTMINEFLPVHSYFIEILISLPDIFL